MSRSFSLPALPVVLALLLSGPAAAATFTVMNLADSGPGSLRQTVVDANAAAGADEVTFAPGLSGTITLTTDQIAITDPLVVSGPGIGVLTISGNDLFRIFLIEKPAVDAPIDVALGGLTLTHGRGVAAGTGGGAVLGLGENLRIVNCVISDSRSDTSGGGIAFESFSMRALLTIESSTISGNHAATFGGGIFASDSALQIVGTTLSGNVANQGGGINAPSTHLEILNSTLSGNHAQSEGGGIAFSEDGEGDGSLLLRLTTINNNSAEVQAGSLLVTSSIPKPVIRADHSIFANGTPFDLAGTGILQATISATYSLIETQGTLLVLGTNNLIGVDPLLGQLANNGGPNLTHMPLPGSPVLNAGDPAIGNPPATDQRGSVRIVGPAIDLGSVEGGAFVEVPTLSQVGLFLLVASLLVAGTIRLRRHEAARPVA